MDSSVRFSIKLVCILSMFWCPSLFAQTLGLLVDEDSGRARKFQSHLSSLVPNHDVNLATVEQLTDKQFDIWVTVTHSALEALAASTAKKNASHVLALFVSPSEAQNIRKTYPSFKFSLLNNVPSVRQQMALIRAIKPQVATIGVYYSRQSKHLIKEVKNAGKALGLKILTAPLKDALTWDRTALRVLKQSDIILGVNDNSIYNATNIRSILMRLYRANRPLVGPDKAYVRAGAVASLYSGVSDTLKATSDLINGKISWANNIQNPYFQVSVNRQVARSLQFSLEDESVLKAKVKSSEVLK